jgi:hypothetical protein
MTSATGLTCEPTGSPTMPVAGLRSAQTVSNRRRRARPRRRISPRAPRRPSARAASLCDRPAPLLARKSPPQLSFGSRVRLSPPYDDVTAVSKVWCKSEMRRLARTPEERRQSRARRAVLDTHPLQGAPTVVDKRCGQGGQLQTLALKEGGLRFRRTWAARSRPLSGPPQTHERMQRCGPG